MRRLFASSSVSIETWNPKPDFYQQSSENIWSCACEAVKVRRLFYVYGVPEPDARSHVGSGFQVGH